MIGALYVLIFTAMACACLGNFLVLKGEAMITDALGHTVLLGIMIMFLAGNKDLNSPLLLFGAALFGLISVFCIHLLAKLAFVHSDGAAGLILCLFFALAIILISKYARNSMIGVDTVLSGEILLTVIFPMQIGPFVLPRAAWFMGAMLLVNMAFLIGAYRSMEISTFDYDFAKSMGEKLIFVRVTFMFLLSMTAVLSFQAAGSILVVSLFIAPAATAYLFTKKLWRMILFSLLIAAVTSVFSYHIALRYNVSMTGVCASLQGALLFIAVVIHPKGALTQLIQRHSIAMRLQEKIILDHLAQNWGTDMYEEQANMRGLSRQLAWSYWKVKYLCKKLQDKKWIEVRRSVLYLTEQGFSQCEKEGFLTMRKVALS